MDKLKRNFVLLLAAAVGGLLLTQYLRLLKPAQAREDVAACNGLKPSPVNPALDFLDGSQDGQFTPPVPAPDFTVQDHQGNMVSLSSFRGRIVMLNFWASWCAVCKSEKRGLEKVQRIFDRDDVVVLSLASNKTWEEVREVMPKGSELQVYLDPPPEGENLGTVARTYGVTAVPETFIIDREGLIQHYIINRRDWAGDAALTCLRTFADQ